MNMSEMITAVRHQISIRAILGNVLNPCSTKGWVTIGAGELTGSVETDFKRFEVNIILYR